MRRNAFDGAIFIAISTITFRPDKIFALMMGTSSAFAGPLRRLILLICQDNDNGVARIVITLLSGGQVQYIERSILEWFRQHLSENLSLTSRSGS